MGKQGIFGIILGLLLIGILALPMALRAIPPRYVARFLPQTLQDLAAPKQESSILPTVVQPIDASALLAELEEPAQVEPISDLPPATFTPIPTIGGETISQAVATPTLSPTIQPTPTNTPIPIPAAARLEGFQHHFQTWNNCGPATMAMTLSYFGLRITQNDTAAVLKPNPEDRNVSPYEMVDYVNEQTEFVALSRVNGRLDTLKRLVANNIPVIIELGIDPPGEYRWLGWYGHYLLVVAYDDANEQFWVFDSWFGTSLVPGENANANGRDLPYSELETFWPHFNNNYIPVYKSEQAVQVANIVGTDMDDAAMWQNSLVTAQRNAAADPENPFFWFNLGTTYNALADYEKAATAFDQARSLGLPWRMLWYQFGPYEAYYQVGRYEDMILLADVTLKDRPYFEESFYYKGLALAAQGESAAAQNNFEDAADFNPNFAPAIAALNR